MAVVRGDHDVNEVRLARALGVDEVFLAGEADVEKATGAKVGFAGPVGFKGQGPRRPRGVARARAA